MVKSGGKNCIMRCKVKEAEDATEAPPEQPATVTTTTVTAEVTQESETKERFLKLTTFELRK